MATGNRIETLAEKAKQLTHLSVADQFSELAESGLKLDDVNWKNRVSDPNSLESRIPTTSDGTIVR